MKVKSFFAASAAFFNRGLKFNLLCFSVITFFILWSCSDDVYHSGVKNVNNDKQKVSFSDFKKATGLREFKTKFKIPKSDQNITARNADGTYEASDFDIDTTYIRKVVVQDKVTYTFWVTPKVVTSKNFYNMTVYKEGNDWQTSIIEFHPSDAYLEKFENGENPKYEGTAGQTYRSGNFPGTGCITIFVEYHHCTGCTGECDNCNICVSYDSFRLCGLEEQVEVIADVSPISLQSGGGGGANTTNPYGYAFGENLPDFGSKEYMRWKMSSTFWNSLTTNQKAWANSSPENTQMYLNILNYYLDHRLQTNAAAFAKWSVNFMDTHPETTWENFQKWFMAKSEGHDGTDDFDQAFWDNLDVPQQQLPTMDDFFLAFPSHLDDQYDTPSKMFNAVGGMPLSIYNQNPNTNGNTCALRLSKALHGCAITIPNIPSKTFLGADGKYYFLGAKNMLAWMKKTFGTPTGSNHLVQSQGGPSGENFPSLLHGKQGIYFLVPAIPGVSGFNATGHADMFWENDCDGGCYFNATGGVSDIFFWELN